MGKEIEELLMKHHTSTPSQRERLKVALMELFNREMQPYRSGAKKRARGGRKTN